MDVKEILCMKEGDEENSYANAAALITLKVGFKARHVVEKAVRSLVKEQVCCSMCLNVADLGCGFGPQPLDFMSTVLRSAGQICNELKQCRVSEIEFLLNDLVGNDFNTLFKELSVVQQKHTDVTWFAMAAPGSFHGRVFPRNSLHLVHSCYSVHWLSKAPEITDEAGFALNKSKIYISESSPPEVSKAYLSQFQQDFSSILKFRSQELAANGRMVLIFNGRQSADAVNQDACYFWDILAEAASYLVSQGLIEQEKLDTLNIPYYNPSQEEVEEMLDKEDTFTTEFIDTFTLEIGGENMWSNPEARIKCYRSFSEAIFSRQFGEDVMNKLYDKTREILADDLKHGKEATKHVTIVVLLKKKNLV